ncbi:hypothetical protein C7M84_011276, partial [Penaeus vannamei]
MLSLAKVAQGIGKITEIHYDTVDAVADAYQFLVNITSHVELLPINLGELLSSFNFDDIEKLEEVASAEKEEATEDPTMHETTTPGAEQIDLTSDIPSTDQDTTTDANGPESALLALRELADETNDLLAMHTSMRRRRDLQLLVRTKRNATEVSIEGIEVIVMNLERWRVDINRIRQGDITIIHSATLK